MTKSFLKSLQLCISIKDSFNSPPIYLVYFFSFFLTTPPQKKKTNQEQRIQVRFIAAEIPLGFMEGVHPTLRAMLEPPLLSFATVMAKQKVDFEIDLVWDEDNEGKPCIHAIAPAQVTMVFLLLSLYEKSK